MQILSFLFKKPQTGDKGSVFWPALEGNFQQLNDHTHNGTNSSKLTSKSVTATTQTITSAGWVSVGGGVYRQLVTVPAGISSLDDYMVLFKNQIGFRNQMNLATEKQSATTYYVYINDNSVNLIAYYLS